MTRLMWARRTSLFALLLPPLLGGCGGRASIGGARISLGGQPSVKVRTTASGPFAGARTVQARSHFGDVTAEGGSDTVEVTAELTVSGKYPPAVLQSWADKLKPVARVEGDRVVIDTPRPQGMPQAIDINPTYHLRVPRQVALDLESSNGKVVAGGVSGDVRAASDFGDVKVTDAGGAVDARSTNGRVEVSGAGGEIQTRSSFGEVRVNRARGRVTAHSENGGVDVSGAGGDVEAESSFGSVNVKRVTGSVHAKSSNGSVDAQEITNAKEARLESSFGSVRFAGAAETLSAESANGSVTLDLDSVPRQTTATSQFGSVTVTLPAQADADIDAGTSFGQVDTSGLRSLAPASLRPASGGPGGSWKGRLGAGGNTLKAHSSNGGVTLRQR